MDEADISPMQSMVSNMLNKDRKKIHVHVTWEILANCQKNPSVAVAATHCRKTQNV